MTKRSILTLSAGAALLAGCAQTDPLLRDGVWRPEHVNRTDLTLQANPSDLVRGTGDATASGQLAAAAVDRLYTNKVKKLPEAGLSQVQVTSQGGNSGGQ